MASAVKTTIERGEGSWAKAGARRWLRRIPGCLLSFCLPCSPTSRARGDPDLLWWAAGLCHRSGDSVHQARCCCLLGLSYKVLILAGFFGGLQMKEGMQHSILEKTEQNFTKMWHFSCLWTFFAKYPWVKAWLNIQTVCKDQHNLKKSHKAH